MWWHPRWCKCMQKFLWIVIGFIRIIWYFNMVCSEICCYISHLSPVTCHFLVYGEKCVIVGCQDYAWGRLIFRKTSGNIESIRLPCSISGSRIWMQPWNGCSYFVGSLLEPSCNRKLLNWSCPGKSLMFCWRWYSWHTFRRSELLT